MLDHTQYHNPVPGWRDIPLTALRTRRGRFLAEVDRLFPWRKWECLIELHYPKRGRGRPPFPLRPLLRLHLLQQWFNLSDQAAEELALDSMAVREFLGLGLIWSQAGTAPDESTLLHFRRLLTRHGLAVEIATDAAAALASQGWNLRPGTITEAGIIAARLVRHNPT